MVTVQSFDNYFSASIILTRLQAEGVECYLKDENTVTIDPMLSNAIGGIKLVVKEEDAAAVIKLLRSYHIEYMLSATCPECGSNSFTHIAKPKVANYLTAILTYLFAGYAVAPEYVYQCGNCGYECESLPDKKEELSKEEKSAE
jgi:Putative prokaryotic signal transducing protein